MKFNATHTIYTLAIFLALNVLQIILFRAEAQATLTCEQPRPQGRWKQCDETDNFNSYRFDLTDWHEYHSTNEGEVSFIEYDTVFVSSPRGAGWTELNRTINVDGSASCTTSITTKQLLGWPNPSGATAVLEIVDPVNWASIGYKRFSTTYPGRLMVTVYWNIPAAKDVFIRVAVEGPGFKSVAIDEYDTHCSVRVK